MAGKDDPLDNEISVSGELTERGVKAKAKSRTLSALDRFFGNVVDLANVKMERFTSRERATAAAEKRVIEAAAKNAVEQIGSIIDDDSKRALLNHFSAIFREQANKDAVAREAIEDLRENPPSEAEAATGPEELSEAFVNRAEQYARFASTDELRQRWGRVIAAEVRRPGTFSEKVLRIVDELDSETAQLFEKLCKSRLRDILPKSLVGTIPFTDVTALTTADLLIEPGIGQILRLGSTTDKAGVEMWSVFFNQHGIAFPKSATPSFDGQGENPPLILDHDKPSIPTYALTPAGVAVSSILPDHEGVATDMLFSSIKSAYPNIQVRRYVRGGGDEWVQIR